MGDEGGVQDLGIDLVQFIRRSEPRDDCLCPEAATRTSLDARF
jgi:hypothetical protein